MTLFENGLSGWSGAVYMPDFVKHCARLHTPHVEINVVLFKSTFRLNAMYLYVFVWLAALVLLGLVSCLG